jgi:two-component system, LytTR family, sensor kinase
MEPNPQTIAPAIETRARAQRRSELILILAFWAFAVLMLSVRALFVDVAPLSVIGPRRLLAALFGALLCYGMARLLQLLRNRSFPERVVWGVVGAFAMSMALTAVTMTLNRIVLPLPGRGFSLAESAQWVMVWFGYLLAWTGTHLALTYHWESQQHQRRAVLLAEMAREAQRAALRYQLNPHFLFNTLNSVASLVGESRNAEAEAMLLNLAAFVRSTLTAEPSGTISLREEIELQRLYLGIEQARFEERLRVEIDLPAALAETRVPALILQPLVENAVRHGVARSEDRLTIRIAARAKDEGVEIVVEDDGNAGPAAGGTGLGLGLRNVEARLRAHFGERGVLAAAPRPGGGFCARIALPGER